MHLLNSSCLPAWSPSVRCFSFSASAASLPHEADQGRGNMRVHLASKTGCATDRASRLIPRRGPSSLNKRKEQTAGIVAEEANMGVQSMLDADGRTAAFGAGAKDPLSD